MSTAPDPWAEGDYAPAADPLPADVAQAFVDYAVAEHAQATGAVPYTLTPQAEAALDAAEPEPEMTVADEAAALTDAWGPAGPSASYAEWVAEGRHAEPEAEL